MSQPRLAQVAPLVAVLTLVWGTNWALFPLAVREVSVWTFRATCLTGAGVLLLLIARMRGESLRVPRAAWPALVSASLVYLVIWNVASTYAAILIPSGQAAILGFTMPVWTTLLAWALFRERPAPRLLLAVALSAAGVGVLMYAARGVYAKAPMGFALGLLAGIGWAGGTLVLKRASLSLPAAVLTGWQLLIAAVPIGFVAFVLAPAGPQPMPSWSTIAVIAYITIVPMALGNALWFSIVGLLPVNVSGLSSVMVPIVAMITGALVHGEPLAGFQLAAMACCASGLLLALARRS
jgi:drug/metabolite transporter (DMT)-like permease